MQSYDGFRLIPTFFVFFVRVCYDTSGCFVTTGRKLDTGVAFDSKKSQNSRGENSRGDRCLGIPKYLPPRLHLIYI